MLYKVYVNGEMIVRYTYDNLCRFVKMNGANIVNSVKYANGSRFAYGRNPHNFEILSVTQSTEDGEANATEIIRSRGLPVEVKSGNTVIGYEYDCKGRKTKVEINGVEQSVYGYTGYSVDGSAITYGTTTQSLADGTVIETSRTGVADSAGKVKITESVKANGAAVFSTLYNAKGLAEKVTDGVSGETAYTYDSYKYVTKAVLTENSAAVLTEDYTYNAYGELSQKTISGAVSQVYSYAYKTNAARDLEYVGYDTYKFYPLTDVNDRNIGREIFDGENKIAGEYITYRKVGDHATNMPASVWFGGGNVIKDSIKYKYDSCGNICEITQNGHIAARYRYDSLNRLIREDNKALNKTVVFTYDINGNITERCEYAYTTKDGEELSELTCAHYGYDYDGDKLVSYNGADITYNALGNPTNYRGNAITWQYGNRLTKFGTTTFSYNGAGRRVSKGNIIFTYDSEGRLIKQSDGLEFIYDNSGVASVIYNGATYLYRKDAQGNIIALLDNNGNIVVQYVYDAWGNHVVYNSAGAQNSDATFIGNVNPFRYRGYYYDVETGLYFLQTRYYDPVVCRFISRDSIEYADPESINGLNLYVYCSNNPVMNVDPYGGFALTTFGILAIIGIVSAAMVLGGGAQLASNAIAGENGSDLWRGVAGAALGAGANALALCLVPLTGGASIVISAVIGASIQTGVDTLENAIRGDEISLEQIALDLGINFATTSIGNWIGAKSIPTNPGWFKPQKFLSVFLKPYGQKILLQTAIGAGISGIVNLIRKIKSKLFNLLLID